MKPKDTEYRLYCASLYCEGNGVTKSYAFVTIQSSEEIARQRALDVVKFDFPISDGWGNHQVSIIEVSKQTILELAETY